MDFTNKTIALGVTGGIAAYKACDIVSNLKRLGASVHVVMTTNATEFITPLTLETLSGNRVIIDMFKAKEQHNVRHISLANKADIFLIAPATANFIAKYTHGIADDFLSTTILAFKGKVLIAPAMNTNMLEHPATIANIELLKTRGVHFIESDEGMLACGIKGKGRLAKPNDIVEATHKILNPNLDYKDKTVLVTAGATIAQIDPVRYITNYSSGKMGIAIAQMAACRGAKVILVHGKSVLNLPTNPQTECILAPTTQVMCDIVCKFAKKSDFIIKAAAPCDYELEENSQKIKSDTLQLNLKKGVDIAATVGKSKGKAKLIIFAAETQDLIKNAKQKLKNKNADMVVANDVTTDGAGFNTDTNIATIITNKKSTSLDKVTKLDLANIILDEAKEL